MKRFIFCFAFSGLGLSTAVAGAQDSPSDPFHSVAPEDGASQPAQDTGDSVSAQQQQQQQQQGSTPPPPQYGANPAPEQAPPPAATSSAAASAPYGAPQAAPPPTQPAYPGYGGVLYHRQPYVEGMNLPPNAVVVTRVRKGLVIGGIAAFLGSYVPWIFIYSFVDAFGGDAPGTMLIPFIGPFFFMDDTDRGGRAMLAFDAILQIGGVTAFILGLTLKQKYVEWYADSRFRVTPLAGRQGGGLDFSLQF